MRIFVATLAAAAALALAGCQTTAGDDGDVTAASGTASSSQATSYSDPNDSLHDRVHDALMEQMGPAVNDLGVRVEGSKVFLTGHVHSEADKQKAHDIAHGVAGATVVDISGLSVQP